MRSVEAEIDWLFGVPSANLKMEVSMEEKMAFEWKMDFQWKASY